VSTAKFVAGGALGLSEQGAYHAAVSGVRCDDSTRERLRAIDDAFDWRAVA
jgi:hypothetical protein